jgi:HD-GYP domain-containing protein (c-di-GMP phosphodiesterase class II)
MEELRQLEYMSQLLATAINIAGLWEKERMLTLEFIDSLNAALEVRDKYTAGHVERVKLYAELIATAMGLPPEEIEYIRTAAILHDLGKIGVPDAILKKAGSLSEEERQAIQSHVLMTDEILKKLSYFDKARELARYHHEAFDGGGYVLGIQGEGIPLGARIIAVSDAFDAMTSERAYRRPFYVEEAVEILRDPAITQWDQNIVRVFLSLIKTDQFRLRAVKEGLICLEEGKYCRDSSALKFKRYASFFAQGPEGQ